MKRLSDVALVGTGRLTGDLPSTGTPVDALVAQADVPSPEARALLAAGAEAVYRQAGLAARTSVAVPPPAPAERLPACGPRAAEVLRELLYDFPDLLPEALERLAQAGQRLAPGLLPLALDARRAELREALVPALGERGVWLARFNPDWAWVLARAPEDGAARLQAWEESGAAERLAALRRERAERPEVARGWLEAAWKQERAEQRAALLGALAEGLGAADEPLLESALDDRSQAVRAAAADLLSLLPDSQLARRMRARADALLTLPAPEAGGGLWGAVKSRLTGGSTPALQVAPPAALPRDWERDGIGAKPPQGVGERAHWLAQLLGRVPPAHLEARFGLGSGPLVAAIAASEWSLPLALGASHAALHFGASAWAAPLWDFWRALPEQARGAQGQAAGSLLLALLPLMPREAAQARALQLLAGSHGSLPVPLESVLAALPAPWSAELASDFLTRLTAWLAQTDGDWRGAATLAPAALALPPAAFARALQLASSCDTSRLPHAWGRALDAFHSTLRMRQRLLEEIHP